jgi:hypothetical protein
MRAAGEGDRASPAIRSGRPTDRLPELHDRLVELAGVRGGKDRREGFFESGADERRPHVALLPGPTGRDPPAVRLERDHGSTERDRRDGAGGVRADARKGLELGHGGREPPVPRPRDPAGRREHVVGAGIIAGPLPELQYPARRRARERADRGERTDEPLEVRRRLCDARLLQEDLRDPDPVRVPVLAPGQRPPVLAIPTNEGRRECGRERRRGRRSGAHGPPPPDGAET